MKPKETTWRRYGLYFSLCLIVLLVLTPLLALYLRLTPRETRVRLNGVIVDKDTNEPVADARIVV
jgi:hypothetical protein